MALTSETQPSPNGVNCIEHESAEILDDEVDLEDGEIFEDEDPGEIKEDVSYREKPKLEAASTPVLTPALLDENPIKKTVETEKTLKKSENDKPVREQLVPFIRNKVGPSTGKRKQFDSEDDIRWKKEGVKRKCERSLEGETRHEDEEEMMFIRGASPNRSGDDIDKWERPGEDDDRPELSRRSIRPFRGRGARRDRARGRGRGRGGLRGGKRKRDEPETCKFFLQGHCRQGTDCTFSHEVLPPRKPELCKFFLKDCCAKKDKCLYMHSEFPCRFFHTGQKCYANKKCKFSHSKLTEQQKNILAKHIDTAPKDILGDFPRRDGRDRDRDMRGDPRDMRGDPRDMRGDPRDMRGDPRDMRGDPRDMRGDPRDMRGDMRGDLRDMRGDPRDTRGDTRDMRGDTRDMRGDTRDMRGDTRDMRGDTRDMRGDTRDMRGDTRDMRGDIRDMRSDPRDVRADSRDERGDMRGDLRDMRGDLRETRGDSRDRTDPRDIRGDSRDSRVEFGSRNRVERDRRIPSIFDLRVSLSDDMRNPEENSTPMPSPSQRSQESSRSSAGDRDNHSSEKEREKEKERHREHERHKHEKLERLKERKAKKERSKEHKKERKEKKEKERERRRAHRMNEKTDFSEEESNKNNELMSPTLSEDCLKTEKLYEAPFLSEDQDKRNTSTEESELANLPKKQRELYLRIKQQQREAENSQASANDDDDEDANKEEENWYSSDEDNGPTTSLPSILKSLTQTSAPSSVTNTVATTAAPSANPLLSLFTGAISTDANKSSAPTLTIPSNLDLSNLSSIFEALKNMNSSNTMSPTQQQTIGSTPATTTATSVLTTAMIPSQPEHLEDLQRPEPPRARDPRLRMDPLPIDSHRSSTDFLRSPAELRRSSLDSSESQVIDVDLRLKSVGVGIGGVVGVAKSQSDVDLRSLPFKPVTHTAASEIDASIASHPPVIWILISADIIKADYASLQIQPRPGVNDPRLRRAMRPVTKEGDLPRDPRQRLMDPRQPLLPTPSSPILSGPPPTPRYDEDSRSQFYRMDSDMRQFPPPTPRLEEEAYIPGPSRPVDPRQRNLSTEDPRRSHFLGRPDDIDLRTQITQRVPFVNFTK